MRIRLDLFLIASCFFASPYASGATQDDSWQNLKHVTRERYYTVLDRKSNCVTGHIVAANDREITLKLPDATTATFDRANVFRVSVSQAAPYFPPRVQADVDRIRDIIYNDKSSWDDLQELAAIEKIRRPGQEVKVVKADGNKYEGRLSAISDTQLELDRTGGKLTIAKADVAQVYYLRYKPLTDSEKYSAQEDFWIDPRLWPYYLHLVPKLPVRLYDSSRVEDDTPVRCKNDSKEKPNWDFCFSGDVQSIDPSSLTLQRPGKEAKTVQLSKDTSVRIQSRQGTIGDIKQGDQIIACGLVENGPVAKSITKFK